MCCLVNVHAYKCTAVGVPIFIRGSQNPMKMGTQGSLKYYENRDLGPHFSMKMGTWGPQFGGPYFYMTPDVLHSVYVCIYFSVAMVPGTANPFLKGLPQTIVHGW